MTHPAHKSPVLRRPVLLQVALLLLLLSMQSYTLAHELDQGNVHDGSICVACSVGGLDSAVTTDQECIVSIEAGCFTVSYKAGSPDLAPWLQPETRAPPHTL